ncbi:hypothetical protein [Pseudomonas cannabina]|uniref:hypothetical protein n=1 Tax=Pseudomonas cannabina TaxID=86840 RepID=UPI0009432D81|nr:hypothetical protein [Pseudomonas cannabina]
MQMQMQMVAKMRGKHHEGSRFEVDILRLRHEGLSYDAIALWIATHKKTVVSVGAIRGLLRKLSLKTPQKNKFLPYTVESRRAGIPTKQYEDKAMMALQSVQVEACPLKGGTHD